MTISSSSLVLMNLARFGGRGSADFFLLLIGLVFAGVIVWAIERSGKTTA
jgi:hypothetical protein